MGVSSRPPRVFASSPRLLGSDPRGLRSMTTRPLALLPPPPSLWERPDLSPLTRVRPRVGRQPARCQSGPEGAERPAQPPRGAPRTRPPWRPAAAPRPGPARTCSRGDLGRVCVGESASAGSPCLMRCHCDFRPALLKKESDIQGQ